MCDVQAQALEDLLQKTGEAGALIAAIDWTCTPLGPRRTWPQGLKTALSIVLSSPVPMVLLWGEDGIMLYNDAYSILAAARHPQLLGSKVREGWPEVADFNDHVMKVGLAGGTLSYKNQELTLHRHGRPEQVFMNLDYSPVLDESGEPAGVLAIVVETTERVAAERRLSEGEARFRALVNASSDVVYRMSPDWTELRQLGGRGFIADTDKPSVRWLDAYVFPEDRPRIMAAVHEAVRTQSIFELEHRVRRVDGTAGWTFSRAVPVFGADGQIAEWFGMAGDITARRHAEEALRESAARLGFLDRLAAATAPLADADAVLAITTRLLGEHLDLSVCAYADMDEDEDGFTIRGDWAAPGAKSIVGHYSLGDFGKLAVKNLSIGLPLVVNDNLRELAPEEAATFQNIGIAATICMPLVKEGRLTALMAIHDRVPRVWTEAELSLLREVTARSWAHVERVAAIAELRASEAQFRLMADAVPQIVWITDPDGRVEFFNKQWSNYTGAAYKPTTAAEVAASFVHPDDAEPTMAAFDQARRTGGTFLVEHRIRSRAGVYRWFLVRAEPYRHPQTGEIVRWFGASVDIHDRRQVEAALRESDVRLRELNDTLERRVEMAIAERDRAWNNARDLLLVIGTDGMVRAVNPAWTSILGWTSDELVGRSYLELIHADDRSSSWRAFADASRKELPAHENRCRHKDGSCRWVSWVAVPEGDLIYASGRDVTAEKVRDAELQVVEAARRQADALYRAYFENTAEALFVVGVLPDGGFTVEDLNPVHQASIGFHLADVAGKRIDEILPPDMAELVSSHYRHVVASGQVYQYRESFEIKGKMTYWDTVLVPVHDHDGQIIRLIGSSRDLTQQLAVEDALRQSQKMEAMGQLTGGVAHDFNNLLTPIVGALDMLQRKGLGGEREQRLIAGAAQSAERAKVLVQRLLAFARRQPLQSMAVDMAKLVSGMADLVASTTGPQIRVVVEIAEDLPPAKADPHQLEMAILNLTVNARDAMPDGGTLRISVTEETVHWGHGSGLRPGRYVQLSVADTGVGMDEATLKRAVEPFFSTKGVGKGTGLGLSMAHGLASQLGGALHIASRPGLGTNVELLLPLSSEVAKPADLGPEPASMPTLRATVLLVDDEELVRLSTADMLADLGYNVVEAESAEEALHLIESGLKADLLLTDHLMPGLSGTDLARMFQASMPVLVVSGYAEAEGIAPDLPRLTKPFRKNELAESLVGLSDRSSF